MTHEELNEILKDLIDAAEEVSRGYEWGHRFNGAVNDVQDCRIKILAEFDRINADNARLRAWLELISKWGERAKSGALWHIRQHALAALRGDKVDNA